MVFKGLYISPKEKKRIILNDYMQNIYFGFDYNNKKWEKKGYRK
jgi:hypothetical protein